MAEFLVFTMFLVSWASFSHPLRPYRPLMRNILERRQFQLSTQFWGPEGIHL